MFNPAKICGPGTLSQTQSVGKRQKVEGSMPPKKKRPLSEEEVDSRVPPVDKQASTDSALGSDSIVRRNEALLKSREDKVNEILANIPASLLKDFDRLYEPIPVVDAKCGWSSVMPKSCKIIIKCTASSLSVMSLDDVNDVFMVFADDEFCRIFLYNQSSFSCFPVSRLVPRDTLHQLKVFKNALLRGKSVMEFVAMNRSDGVLLNTHVTLTSINGSSKTLNDKLNLIEKVTSGQDCTPIECWGVLTIRNSRCISEAKYSGAGVFGMHDIINSRDLFGSSCDVRGVIPSEEQVTDAV